MFLVLKAQTESAVLRVVEGHACFINWGEQKGKLRKHESGNFDKGDRIMQSELNTTHSVYDSDWKRTLEQMI